MSFDLATAVQATGATVLRRTAAGHLVANDLHVSDLVRSFSGAVVDSRLVRPGALFVALPGERVDGHDFLVPALEAGAGGFLVAASERARIEAALDVVRPAVPALLVPDPLKALQAIAREHRRRRAPTVVGITGSLGKTTTKEIVAGVLCAEKQVLASAGNLNTEIGLPLTLLDLEERHEVAVLEMGMYVPGDISLLAAIAEPDIGIVTTVAPIHLERCETIERIARAKSELPAALPPEGLAILNGDNRWTRAMAQVSTIARALLFGNAEDCDFRATDIETHGLEGVSFTLHAEGTAHRLRTAVPGAHTVPAFLAAIAVARAVGMDWEAVTEAVAQVRLDVRQRILRPREDILLIDDSYNAAPPSMEAALDLLAAAGGRKIAVLGDMLELGPDEEVEHRTIGRRAASVADWLIVRGSRGHWIAEEAARAGLAPDRVVEAASNEEAARTVLAITATPEGKSAPTMQRSGAGAQPGWVVLVKGSRGMALDEVVRELRGTP